MSKQKGTFCRVVYSQLAVLFLGIQSDSPAERAKKVIEISTLLDLLEKVEMTANEGSSLSDGLSGLPSILYEAGEVTVSERMNRVLRNLRPPGGPDTPVSDLGMSVRATNSLLVEGIETVGELIRKTQQELLELPLISNSIVQQIKDALATRGLALGM